MEIVNEFANVGLTVLIMVIAVILGAWLDRNVFNKDRYKRRNK
mgnify:CR=1 FL=1